MDSKTLEKVHPNPLLHLILQRYTETARNSIHGPVALKDDLPQIAVKKTVRHTSSSEIPLEFQYRTTYLEGYTVACFLVGGEKRLCFSELVHTVLKDINVQEIFEKRDKLLIFTSKCSMKQLDELKYNGVLPWTSSSSNLITKSDSYRLIGALQNHLAPKDRNTCSPSSFQIYHECFGGCGGVFDAERYVKPQSLCIKCDTCKGLFSPPSFTTHSHSSFDNVHTCHWGFDTVRWRSYIMLVENQVTPDLIKTWNDIKLKFNNTKIVKSAQYVGKDQIMAKYPAKKDKQDRDVLPLEIISSSYLPKNNTSAFQPWSLKNRQDHILESSQNNKYTVLKTPNHSNVDNPCLTKVNDSKVCRFQSSVYMDCVHCKNAVESNSKFCDISEKINEDIKPKIEPNFENIQNQEKTFELMIKKVLEKYISIDTVNVKDLVHHLSNEFKQLNISQDKRLQEALIMNHHLENELQSVKLKSKKKIAEIKIEKDQIEQEIETLHRERQKEITLFNQMRWELNHEVSKNKVNKADDIETIQKENILLKMKLEQILVDREDLHKQLTWQLNKKKKQSWMPFPLTAQNFSSCEDKYTEYNTFKRASSCCDSSMANSSLSPAPKSRKIDYPRTITSTITQINTAVSEENSDIDVDD
uniref:Ski oncogene n=1 Tax=Hydra vulgaris TaxID=6087 RepID=T2MGI2_HYDVU